MVVDASVWVAGLVSQDAHHVASRVWLDEQFEQGIDLVIPTLALAEVAGAVARRTRNEEAGRRALRAVQATPLLRLVPLDEKLGESAAELAASLSLRGADAVYVAVARALGVPLFTWDRELLARASGMIDVSEPLRSA